MIFTIDFLSHLNVRCSDSLARQVGMQSQESGTQFRVADHEAAQIDSLVGLELDNGPAGSIESFDGDEGLCVAQFSVLCRASCLAIVREFVSSDIPKECWTRLTLGKTSMSCADLRKNDSISLSYATIVSQVLYDAARKPSTRTPTSSSQKMDSRAAVESCVAVGLPIRATPAPGIVRAKPTRTSTALLKQRTACHTQHAEHRPAMDVLKSYTRAIPPFIRDPAIAILGSKKCYTSLVEDLNYNDLDCLKLGVSKALGVGIVAGGSIVKVPQILKLLNSRSSAGISVLSYVLETTAFLITLGYNVRQGFPFSTYGESAFIAIQNVVITLLVLHYAKKSSMAAMTIVALGASLYALFSHGGISFQTLQYLQTLTIPIALGSKIPQIFTIAKNRSTGQLSAFAVFNYLLGSLARIYTTVTEVNDPLIFWGFLLSTGLNAVLVSQMIYYWNAAPKVKKSKRKSK